MCRHVSLAFVNCVDKRVKLGWWKDPDVITVKTRIADGDCGRHSLQRGSAVLGCHCVSARDWVINASRQRIFAWRSHRVKRTRAALDHETVIAIGALFDRDLRVRLGIGDHEVAEVWRHA